MITVKKFSAAWCGPCRALRGTFNEVKSKCSGVTFMDIDVDDQPLIANQYGVRSIPLVIIEKNGNVVQKIQGNQPASTYVSAINGAG